MLPFSLGSQWNLITRTILPVVYVPDLTAETGGQWGWSGLNMSLFFSPKASGGLIWGVGPVIVLPIASSPEQLGTGKWSAGPTAVALMTPANWVIGALWNQVWSFAGNSDRSDVSQMLIQPFINFNLPKGWYLVTAPIWTANWKAESGEQWLVPLGGGAGKIFAIGSQRFNSNVQVFFRSRTRTPIRIRSGSSGCSSRHCFRRARFPGMDVRGNRVYT